MASAPSQRTRAVIAAAYLLPGAVIATAAIVNVLWREWLPTWPQFAVLAAVMIALRFVVRRAVGNPAERAEFIAREMPRVLWAGRILWVAVLLMVALAWLWT